jgi:hypothetical protein
MMIGVPGQIGTLDEARLQTDHLPVVFVHGIVRTPVPVIPLTYKSTPVLNIQFGATAAHSEHRFLIPILRCGQ